MSARFPAGRALALAGALLLWGCPGPSIERVSDDLQEQAKYETGVRLLRQIRERKKTAEDVFGDCKTAELLLTRHLKAGSNPVVRKLAGEIEQECEPKKAAKSE